MSAKYIKFESGGILSVQMNANLFAMTARDRELYGAITDLLIKWEKDHETAETQSSDAVQP